MQNFNLIEMLRELFRKINYQFRHVVLKKVVRNEVGRDYAVEMLREISEFPCQCEEFVDHNGCPSCLAKAALRDESLQDLKEAEKKDEDKKLIAS